MTFDLGDYVDVAERIRAFKEAHPEGSLQSDLFEVRDETGRLVGWRCKAWAYRTPDDPAPGTGNAVEPVPGKTPYTKDSEAMNAETSAWGRAIVALGFATKKIASRDEVEARTGAAEAMEAARQHASENPQDFSPEITFGKHKGKRVDEVPRPYLEWLVENFEPKTADQEAVLYKAKERLGLVTSGFSYAPAGEEDIPFE